MRNNADRIFNWALPPVAKFISSVFALWLDEQDETINPEVAIIKTDIAVPGMVLYLKQRKITNPVQFANLLLGTLSYSKHSFLSQYQKYAKMISKGAAI